MSPLYWERHPDGPFATLIRIATTYCSPDADEDAYAGLKRLAKRENVEEMRVFKDELREALRDPNRLPDDELSGVRRVRRRKHRGVPAPTLARPVRRRAYRHAIWPCHVTPRRIDQGARKKNLRASQKVTRADKSGQ